MCGVCLSSAEAPPLHGQKSQRHRHKVSGNKIEPRDKPERSRHKAPGLDPRTGLEFGRAYRTDGTAPVRTRAEADKNPCFLDPQEVPNEIVRRINSLAKSDRAAAMVESVKVTISCLNKKGWRIVLTTPDAPTTTARA